MGKIVLNEIEYSGGGDGGTGGIDYSTSEQDTGLKWIDNKPITPKPQVRR